MTYDLPFRYKQALDPSALSLISTGLYALEAAVRDCRNAGMDWEQDPAIILLARHLALICAPRGTDADLREACRDRIAALHDAPILKTLAYRGVTDDAAAKRLFHSEGRAALRRLAEALGLGDNDYDLRSRKGGPASSGEVTLHGEEIWAELTIGIYGPGRELCFRKVRGRDDHCGDRNRWASIRELILPGALAARIRRELGISRSHQPHTLVA
jgi:hypothetical protein